MTYESGIKNENSVKKSLASEKVPSASDFCKNDYILIGARLVIKRIANSIQPVRKRMMKTVNGVEKKSTSENHIGVGSCRACLMHASRNITTIKPITQASAIRRSFK